MQIFLGFGVLIVHYHGSSGVGQKFVDSLPGKVGSLDAEDCYFSLQTALKKFPWLDRNRVLLFGGSHGGFLVTHLSSQYPVHICFLIFNFTRGRNFFRWK